MASANTGSGVAQHSRPLFGKINSTSTPSAVWSASRSSTVRPVAFRNTSSGSIFEPQWRFSPFAFATDSSDGRTSIGRLPSVTDQRDPSGLTSRRGMRSRYSGSM